MNRLPRTLLSRVFGLPSAPIPAPSAGTPSSSPAPSTADGSPSTETPHPSPAPATTSSLSTPDTTAIASPPAPTPGSVAVGNSAIHTHTAVQQSETREKDGKELLIVDALERGTPYREIAQAHSVSIATIGRIAQRMASFESGAVARLMQSKTLQALEHWETAMDTGAKAGKHAAARDWLLHSKVLEPVANEQQAGAKVAIIIGMPGAPASHHSVQVIDTQGVSVESSGE